MYLSLIFLSCLLHFFELVVLDLEIHETDLFLSVEYLLLTSYETLWLPGWEVELLVTNHKLLLINVGATRTYFTT